MTKRVFTGKTVDDAIRKGLAELGVTERDVSVTVLEHPSKGIFGLFGAREAKVEIELLPPPKPVDPIAGAKSFLADILRHMEVDGTIEQRSDEDGNVVFDVSGSNIGVFIGRRGQTMDALQLLVNVYASRLAGQHQRIVLDAERFRERRKKTLEDLSMRLANQVVRTKKEIVLEPMSSQERRVIHYRLQHHPKVKTFSRGEEPNRRIVITLK